MHDIRRLARQCTQVCHSLNHRGPIGYVKAQRVAGAAARGDLPGQRLKRLNPARSGKHHRALIGQGSREMPAQAGTGTR